MEMEMRHQKEQLPRWELFWRNEERKERQQDQQMTAGSPKSGCMQTYQAKNGDK
jgi:hypothetical protein